MNTTFRLEVLPQNCYWRLAMKNYFSLQIRHEGHFHKDLLSCFSPLPYPYICSVKIKHDEQINQNENIFNINYVRWRFYIWSFRCWSFRYWWFRFWSCWSFRCWIFHGFYFLQQPVPVYWNICVVSCRTVEFNTFFNVDRVVNVCQNS